MKKKGRYPSKTTLNLVIKERSQFTPTRLLPLLAVVLLAAAAFGKFAVADRLAAVSRAQAALSAAEQTHTQLTAALVGYDAVEDEYNRYASSWMNEGETAQVDRMEVLSLIEQELMSAGGVTEFALTGNVLSVSLTSVTLSGTSGVVERLYTYPNVVQVEVFNAATGQETGDGSLISLVITLTNATEGGEG